MDIIYIDIKPRERKIRVLTAVEDGSRFVPGDIVLQAV